MNAATHHQQKESATASRLARVLARFRERYPDMTVLQALIYVHVAGDPGVTQRDLMTILQTSDGVLSRNLAILSDVGFRNTPAQGLVELRLNPQDRRVKNLHLTPKGRRLMEDIDGDLYGRK